MYNNIFETFFGSNQNNNQQNNQQQRQQQQQQQQQQQNNQGAFDTFMSNFSQFPNIFGQPQFNPMGGFQRHQQPNTYTNSSTTYTFTNGQPQQQQQQFRQQQQQQRQQSPQQNRQQQQQQQQPYYQQQNFEQQHQRYPSFRNTRSNFHSMNPNKDKKKKQQKEELHEGQAAFWKEKGNQSFKKKEYEQAIKMYTKAIEMDESQSVYYSNRGKCYKMKGDIQKALEDAQNSIELDESSIKGYLLCGQCLAQQSKFLPDGQYQPKLENAIKKMTKALTLCPTQGGQKKKQYERELSIYLLRAKKLMWYKNYESMKEKKLKIIKEFGEHLDKTVEDQEEKTKQFDNFLKMIGNPQQNLDLVIPHHLICKITFDMMEDPVINSAGQTYEREVIEEHIKKNGLIDPVTRENITNNLYSNLAVKQGIDEFLSVNPWAFEFSEFQDPNDIQF